MKESRNRDKERKYKEKRVRFDSKGVIFLKLLMTKKGPQEF